MAFFRGSRGRQLFSYVPFLLLGFVFQLIARHLLYTSERYSGGKFRNFPPLLSHVCPAAACFYGYRITMLHADFVYNGPRWETRTPDILLPNF